jgi:hypothetical protein
VHVDHVHEPALRQPGAAAVLVLPADLADEKPAVHVQLLVVFQEVDTADVEPLPTGHPERE